jgi:MFS superfamily sulfate permease-like transporter
MACFLLAYIEGVSAARTLATKHGYGIDARRELLGLGASNLAVAFVQGFPVAGGLSQSMVNDKAGAKSPLALMFASIALAGCLILLTGLLRNLPSVVLAAVVLVAVKGLVDLSALRRLWRVSRFEFWIAIVAFVSVLLLGILKGVLFAAIVSLVMLVAAAARPTVAVLGRLPGTRRYSDIERNPENESIPGLLIFRVEAALLYFNCEYVRESIWQRVRARDGMRLVIVDLSNSPRVDIAAAQMLSQLQKELAERGIVLRLAEARSRVRDLLRAEGLEEQVGYFGRHLSVDQVVAEFEQSGPTTAPI